jgi:tetratricopeptide (TPR) repeat protein
MKKMKNIFISYCRKDEKWKDLIVTHLNVPAGERSFTLWDDRKINPGTKWRREIQKALENAGAALLLVSADFLNSAFILEKEVPVLLRRHNEEGLPIIPVILRSCNWKKIEWLSGLQAFPKDGLPLKGFSDHEIETLLTQLADRLENPDKETGPGREVPAGPRGKTVMFTRFPYRRIDLIGREPELKDLALRLDQSRRVLLVNGLGGIGKTEVCKTFFLDHYREYAYAGWFDWVSTLRETVTGAFTWESPGPAPANTVSLEERYAAIMGFLQRLEGPALLVFDNIENPADEDLAELTRLPDPVKVIANSRAVVPGFDGKELECLSEALCLELFYRYYDVETDDEGVGRIVGRCARHTLTVELLARTAKNAGLGVRDLERWLEEKGFNLNPVIGDKVDTCWHEVKDRRQFFDHLQSLFDLTGVTGAELAIMKNLSVLPAVYISQGELKEWLGLGDMEAVQGLVSKGWLRREKGKIYMHPVVQEVTRFKAAPGVKDCERLIEALTGKLHVEPGDNPLDKQGYVGYAAAILGNIDETHEKVATLANNLSARYRDLGQLEKALEFQLKALEISEQVLAKNHPSLATSYNNVSTIYQDMGQLEKALEFQLKALEIREQVLAKNHPDLATSYHNLSTIYLALQEIPTALPYAQKAVEILQSLFPNGHPNLDNALLNLEILEGMAGKE